MARSAPIEDVTDDRILRLLRSRAAARTVGVDRGDEGEGGGSAPGVADPGVPGTLGAIPDLAEVLHERAALAGHPAGGPGPRRGWVPEPPGHYGAALSAARGFRRPAEADPAGGEPAHSVGVVRSDGHATQRRPGRHRAPAPRVFTLPASLAAARVRVRAPAILALLAVTLVTALVFGLRMAAAARAGEPVPVAPSRGGLVGRTATTAASGPSALGSSGADRPGGTASGGGVSGAGETAGPSVGIIVVHVVGEVAAPGVVRVPIGSRVIDAITAAGGSVGSADLKRINLARVLQDGEQVHVPAPGEPILAGSWGSTLRPDGGAGGVGGASSAASTRVDLNSADLAALDGLPGVGPVLAQRILDWRAEHGRFTSVDELGEVSGIGEKLLAVLTPKVTV